MLLRFSTSFCSHNILKCLKLCFCFFVILVKLRKSYFFIVYIDYKLPLKFVTIVSVAVWNAGINQIFSNDHGTKINYMRTVRYFGSIFSEKEAQMIGLTGKTNNKGYSLVWNLTKIYPNVPQWARGIDYMLLLCSIRSSNYSNIDSIIKYDTLYCSNIIFDLIPSLNPLIQLRD